MYDLNDAPAQRGDLIPDGTFACVRITFKNGGIDPPGCAPEDRGLLKKSKTTDSLMLDCEVTVLKGPHTGRHCWFNGVLIGGETDDKGQSKAGNITRATLRAIIESGLGIHPADTSPAAAEKRRPSSYKSIEQLMWAAKFGVETSEQYSPKNIIELVVTPNLPEWAPIIRGEDVPPQPRGARKRTGGGAAEVKPAWQTQTPGAAGKGPSLPWAGGAPSPAPSPAPAGWAAPPTASPAPGPGPTSATGGGPPAGGPAWLNG